MYFHCYNRNVTNKIQAQWKMYSVQSTLKSDTRFRGSLGKYNSVDILILSRDCIWKTGNYKCTFGDFVTISSYDLYIQEFHQYPYVIPAKVWPRWKRNETTKWARYGPLYFIIYTRVSNVEKKYFTRTFQCAWWYCQPEREDMDITEKKKYC